MCDFIDQVSFLLYVMMTTRAYIVTKDYIYVIICD